MFPILVGKIKQELLDETPPENNLSSDLNSVPESSKIMPEFVHVKVEIEEGPQPSSPSEENQILPEPYHVKLEPDDSDPVQDMKQEASEDSTMFHYHVKMEPVEPVPEESPYQIPSPHQNEPNLQTNIHINRDSTKSQASTNHCGKALFQINDDGSYRCLKCSRNLKNKHSFSAHKSRGCKPKPDLHCYSCGHTFKKLFNYRAHMHTHSKYPYEGDFSILELNDTGNKCREGYVACPVCKKEFINLKWMRKHTRVHISKEPPFQCPLCKKIFTLKYNAQKHLLIHQREKILTCTICNKTFPRESRLRYHLNSHVKMKLFTCDVCGRRMSHKSNVIRHILRKHPGLIKEGLYGPYK